MKNCISRLCPNPLGDPPPTDLIHNALLEFPRMVLAYQQVVQAFVDADPDQDD